MKNLLMLFCILTMLACQRPKNITIIVDTVHLKSRVEPTMWGLFFEDINFAADGGLYAELVKNRSFEFSNPKMGWKAQTNDKDSSHFLIMNRDSNVSTNPRFARLKIDGAGSSFKLINYGFRGMGILKNNEYLFSIWASSFDNSNIKLKAELKTPKGESLGFTTIDIAGKEWKKYEAKFRANQTNSKAFLNISFEGSGSIDIDLVSLFPTDTWKRRRNGLRKDLVQLLAELKPGFLRFPGGCIVEGRELDTRYQWKKTVGKVENRKVIVNRWNTEFKHRPTPDYFQSFGLGFFEYFLLAEDIGAEPLPILNCGMACQFNTAELVPMNELDTYVQDALDLIEFANAPANTTWGKLRTEMGHPEPFHLKFIGIGNEQWGPQYFERYAIFEKIIKEKYPEMKIVSGTGPAPNGFLFDFAKEELKKYRADIVDEHYYRKPLWFLENANRYDDYDRKSYKIFAGEYAAQSDSVCSADNKNNWECAISEAAFMTGLERNADVVSMCSYAPLFAHVEGWQWTPDLIWFDNLRSFGTANYYVQKLFSTNKGTHVLYALNNGKPLTGQDGIYASAVLDSVTKEVIIKMVNASDKSNNINLELTSGNQYSKGTLFTLSSSDLNSYNTLDEPQKIVPKETKFIAKGKNIKVSLAPHSFVVLKIL